MATTRDDRYPDELDFPARRPCRSEGRLIEQRSLENG